MIDEANKSDEIVEVKLPRSQVPILRELIRERETYNHLRYKIKSNMIWFIAGSVLTVILLWEKITSLFADGVIK